MNDVRGVAIMGASTPSPRREGGAFIDDKVSHTNIQTEPIIGARQMVISKLRLPLLVGSALLLGACAQSFASSIVVIDEAYLTDEVRNEIVADVYAKAEQLGGECKLLNSQRQVHYCPLQPDNPSLVVGVGYSPRGDYVLYVRSNYVHWIPQSESKVTSGRFIGDTQKELEEWMRSIVPDEAIVRAERKYSGYDVIQEF